MDDLGPSHIKLSEEEVSFVNLGSGYSAQPQILAILVPKRLLHCSMLFRVELPGFGLWLWIVGHAAH